ncbi:TIGR00730 family Rossman fold protein [soil metagenome]
MNVHSTPAPTARGLSVCLFCGSSNAADPDFLEAAAEFGRTLAGDKTRLVYGGGGIGLMGAAAKACNAAGGEVLGVMPDFLRRREVVYDDVETRVVTNMHDRKRIMFEESDAFAIFPCGVGTLEEVVELMSWRRLDLHRKPIVFLDMKGFWRPLFAFIDHTVDQKVTPSWLPDTYAAVETVAQVLPTVRRMIDQADQGPGFFGYQPDPAELAAKF